jgi:endonuclease III
MEIDWDSVFAAIMNSLSKEQQPLPSVSTIALDNNDPFRVLIATLISLRTKDEVTMAASRRLFEIASTPSEMIKIDVKSIEEAIYPAGFYHVKAKNIQKISKILLDKFGSQVPADRESLLSLPGVGVKTANLTLNLGFGIDAICVDTHVHRISNRLGWIRTSTPEESEKALQKIMPRRFWIPLNELLVSFGQQTCKPISPHCSRCKLEKTCPRIGVSRSR